MLSETYISQWKDVRIILNQIAEKFPDNKDWVPQEGMNPLGKIAKHTALTVYHFLKNYAKVNDTPKPPKELLDSDVWNKNEFIEGLKLTNNLVLDYFNSLTDSDLNKEAYTWTFDDGKTVSYPVAWVVNQFKVHEAWHAAQLKLYLKLMGVDTSKIKGM